MATPALNAQAIELLVAYGKNEGDLLRLPEQDLDDLLDDVVGVDCAEEIQNRKVMCLHWAAERGYTALMEKMLEIGNNIEGLSECQKGATPLALALLHGHKSTVQLLVDKDADVNFPAFEGNSSLHLALATGCFEDKRDTCVELISILLKASANVSAVDHQGCSALHRACSATLPGAVKALLGAGAESVRDYALNLPVHYALLAGGTDSIECLRALDAHSAVGDPGASLSLPSPVDLARALGDAEAVKLLAPDSKLVTSSTSRTRTMLLYSEGCLAHAPSPDFGPESASRLQVLLSETQGALRSTEFKDKVEWKKVTKKADVADVIRVHEYNYVAWLQEQCEKLRKHEQLAEKLAAAAAPAGASGARGKRDEKLEQPHKRLDVDTVITAASYDAAFLAAGAVIEAVDAVLDSAVSNAFCVTRPAGHHAGPRGASKVMLEPGKEGESHGFCLLSNAAIGAAYALAVRGRDKGVARVAIVDFDVHHGNGTEEVVRNLRPSRSSHTHSSAMGDVTVSSHHYKPWLSDQDEHKVFFCSIHAYGEVKEEHAAKYPSGSAYCGQFYPGMGAGSPREQEADASASSSTSSPQTHQANLHNYALGPRYSTAEFRRAVEDMLQKLSDFKPDLLILSAGFDAHQDDKMNYGLVSLCEDDYFWVTHRLRAVAQATCNGRIVSVLEGGYNVSAGPLSPLARCVSAHVRALCMAPPPAYLPGLPDNLALLETRLQEAAAHKQALAESADTRGGRRKRRRAASSAVDYASLDSQMK